MGVVPYRRDDRVLTHTLQRCDNCFVLNAALAAEGAALAQKRLFPPPVKTQLSPERSFQKRTN